MQILEAEWCRSRIRCISSPHRAALRVLQSRQPSESQVFNRKTELKKLRLSDVIEFFFVAHPDSGRKEGEEFKRVMYFYPKNEILDRQVRVFSIVFFSEKIVAIILSIEITIFMLDLKWNSLERKFHDFSNLALKFWSSFF